MKTLSLILLSALACVSANADDVVVSSVRHIGPFAVAQPVVLDSLTLDGKKYSPDQNIDTPLSFSALKSGQEVELSGLNIAPQSLNAVSFAFSLSSYSKVDVKVEGAKNYMVFVADKENASPSLAPGQYDVVVKFIADSIAPSITLSTEKPGILSLRSQNDKRAFTLDDNMEMKRFGGGVALSPSGKYLSSCTYQFNKKGRTVWKSKLTELSTGRVLATSDRGFSWLSKSDRYYQVKNENGQRLLVAIDPATGQEETLARDLPSDQIVLSPTEDYLIYYINNEGPQKQEGVYEVIHPDDRQPGYRSRSSLGKFDFKTGLAQVLTYGSHSTYVQDISSDGRFLLFAVSSDSVTQRPSELISIYRMNLETLEVETLVNRQGFIASASFFPGDASRVLVKGTPEAFGGVGRNLPAEMTPSMYDYQLFAMDVATKAVTPITKDFNPSIEEIITSEADGMVYFTAENGDLVSLYSLNPATFAITIVEQPLEVVGGIDVAAKSPILAFYGASVCVPDQLYTLELNKKKAKPVLQAESDPERMSEIQLGQCFGFTCPTTRGYDVSGFYVLPANIDKTKKYPVIVDYYGGCSPTSRRFGGGSHYPIHYWNSLGYIVLVVNPSGAAGFGQEWAARHVNTAGEGVAEDIIEATEWFADNHPFVNKEKIGCVSASYGGFMTQTLLSKTDLFACGISHAGISSHTSYWGEGYWGYSYSQVSMANSYPWNRKDLYVDRSPLYNADKIHKPILFTHGTADTNVPIGESIQMFNAMRILGVPTAFVMVEGEDHGIMDYSKRKKWINTMLAWFQRWLQDDDSWWKGMYPNSQVE